MTRRVGPALDAADARLREPDRGLVGFLAFAAYWALPISGPTRAS
ncbi:MAG: hypothetical protein ACXW4H_06630 [Candidatus Limnocylindrales bacterium]